MDACTLRYFISWERVVFCLHGKLIGPEVPMMRVVLETKRENPRDHLLQLPGCIGLERVSQQAAWLLFPSPWFIPEFFTFSTYLTCSRGSAVCPGRDTSPLRRPAAPPCSGALAQRTHDCRAFALEDFVILFPPRLACCPCSGSRLELKHCFV